VLRRHLRQAFVWIPANALAWAPALVVLFVGVEAVSGGGFGPGAFVAGTLILAAAGAVVGAIHGLALLWLLRLGGGLPASRETAAGLSVRTCYSFLKYLAIGRRV
jgi:hypothetical protein